MQYYMTKQMPLGPIASYGVLDYIIAQALGICILMQVSSMAGRYHSYCDQFSSFFLFPVCLIKILLYII